MFNKVPYPLTRYASSLGFACLRPESVPQPRSRPEAFFSRKFLMGISSKNPKGSNAEASATRLSSSRAQAGAKMIIRN